MTTIQIPDELAAQIEQGALHAGKSSIDFLREAVLSRLEDIEDIVTATERLKHLGKRFTLAEVIEDLGHRSKVYD